MRKKFLSYFGKITELSQQRKPRFQHTKWFVENLWLRG